MCCVDGSSWYTSDWIGGWLGGVHSAVCMVWMLAAGTPEVRWVSMCCMGVNSHCTSGWLGGVHTAVCIVWMLTAGTPQVGWEVYTMQYVLYGC